jgi:hypothetical protein
LRDRLPNSSVIKNIGPIARLANGAKTIPSGQWSEDDHDVLATGAVIGRIFKANAALVGTP